MFPFTDIGDIWGATELKGPVNYRYEDLKIATKNFSEENKLGRGGFGDVYKVNLLIFLITQSTLQWFCRLYFQRQKLNFWKIFMIDILNHHWQGTLKNGKIVAVKKLALGNTKRIEEDFESEVKLISNVHHRNLVRLLGCCNKGQEKILVYEYMKNNSLDKFLFGNSYQPWSSQVLSSINYFFVINGYILAIYPQQF